MPGWRYTLRIPSWSQVELSDGELVVFFQVKRVADHRFFAHAGRSKGGSRSDQSH